jgi:hypothetical protein
MAEAKREADARQDAVVRRHFSDDGPGGARRACRRHQGRRSWAYDDLPTRANCCHKRRSVFIIVVVIACLVVGRCIIFSGIVDLSFLISVTETNHVQAREASDFQAAGDALELVG